MGRLVLIDSKKAVSNLFNTQDRKFFIFDEINVYASKVLLDLVNKSRSACVTCFCASQSLADLESAVGESFKHQIMENCNNYFIMRQNSFKSAEECAKLIGTMEKMKMTYWCYVKITDTLNLCFLVKSAKCTNWSHLFHGLLDNEPLMA